MLFCYFDSAKPPKIRSHAAYTLCFRQMAETQIMDATLRTLLLEQLPEQIRVVPGMVDIMLQLQHPVSLSAVYKPTSADNPGVPLVAITNILVKIELQLRLRSRSNSYSHEN